MITKKYIDLSHLVENGLVSYKGLPAPVICDYWSREQSKQFYENGESFQIAKIEMVANTGTYLDCPFHRFENGADLAELDLAQLIDLQAVVIRVPHQRALAVELSEVQGQDFKDKAVLIHTGWSQYWNTPKYYENHSYITAEAALYLRDAGAKLVGIDAHNIDDTSRKSRPVHSILLAANILIVEHLTNLSALPDKGFLFSAVPPKFKGVGTFPVRAMATI